MNIFRGPDEISQFIRMASELVAEVLRLREERTLLLQRVEELEAQRSLERGEK
jgi:hypothetical protein